MAEAAAAPAEGAAPPAPKKGMMIGLLVAGLVAGGATGTFVLAPKLAPPIPTIAGDSASEEHGEGQGESEGEGEHGKKGEGEGAAPKLVTLDNIIVNPAGSQGSRFLMTSVAIATDDEKLETSLRDRQVELRDKVTSVLEVMTMQQLTAQGARDTVKSRIQATVIQMLGGKPKLKVFVPQFVIQ